jgi:hypothetical protein
MPKPSRTTITAITTATVTATLLLGMDPTASTFAFAATSADNPTIPRLGTSSGGSTNTADLLALPGPTILFFMGITLTWTLLWLFSLCGSSAFKAFSGVLPAVLSSLFVFAYSPTIATALNANQSAAFGVGETGWLGGFLGSRSG